MKSKGTDHSDILEQKAFFRMLFALIARKPIVGIVHPFKEIEVLCESSKDDIWLLYHLGPIHKQTLE